jgi:hypothetical protein
MVFVSTHWVTLVLLARLFILCPPHSTLYCRR